MYDQEFNDGCPFLRLFGATITEVKETKSKFDGRDLIEFTVFVTNGTVEGTLKHWTGTKLTKNSDLGHLYAAVTHRKSIESGLEFDKDDVIGRVTPVEIETYKTQEAGVRSRIVSWG